MKCKICKKETKIARDAGDTPLCISHYVEQEDEECLLAQLKEIVTKKEKSTLEQQMLDKVKKHKPKLYEQIKE